MQSPGNKIYKIYFLEHLRVSVCFEVIEYFPKIADEPIASQCTLSQPPRNIRKW